MKKILFLTYISILISIIAGKTCLGLEITEISFKDKESDWIEISKGDYETEENENIQVKEDKLIAEISAEELKNNNFILIHFKSSEENRKSENKTLNIYIKSEGLTGTTEQITIEKNETIIDAVCWQNSSPSKSEMKDIQSLKETNIWKGECINSENVKTNNSITKTGKTNSKESWEIFKGTNQAPIAKIEIQKGETEGTVPFSINLDASESIDPDKDKITFKWIFPNNQIIEKANPPSYKFEKEGNYEIKLIVEDEQGAKNEETIKIVAKSNNGDLSNEIIINELFINPSGTDTNKEWIELYNKGSKDINLGNWKIKNGEKETTLSNKLVVKKNNHIIIDGKNLGTSLKNTNGKISIIDFEGKTIDEKSYKETKENMSFSLTKITNNQKKEKYIWIWTENSKNKKNPELHEIYGIINKEATINKDYYFKIKTDDKNTIKIIFDEKVDKFELLKKLFTINKEIKILARKIDEQTYFLIDYEIKNDKIETTKKEKTLSTPKWTYLMLIPVTILTTILIFLKKQGFK